MPENPELADAQPARTEAEPAQREGGVSDPVKCACRSDDAFRCVELRHPEIYGRYDDVDDPPDCNESCDCPCHSEWWNEVYYADED